MNIRMRPVHFGSDGQIAWFVEGFTSDNRDHWVLRFAYLDEIGQPDMDRVMAAYEVPWPTDHPLYNLLYADIVTVRNLLGDWQRFCAGLPALPRRY